MPAPPGLSTRLIFAPLVAVASLSLPACTTLSLAVANLPAAFGSYEVRRDVKYGALDRQALDVYWGTPPEHKSAQ